MDLVAAAAAFRAVTHQAKQQHPDIPWYPHDAFQVFTVLREKLPELDLLATLAGAPVLDLGCGDGELSFFFASLGYTVLAVDSASPNFNQTRGFSTLQTHLRSPVAFAPCDLDSAPRFPGHTYGLALCLGVLYHLKNPYQFLESVSHAARYCLFSTRIAAVTPRGTPMADDPLAYLLDAREANDDDTNYWVFSDAGLRRLLQRTGWDIVHSVTTGRRRRSTPSDSDADQRIFCLLRSQRPDPFIGDGGGTDLAGGWHPLEAGSWRWTTRQFSVTLPVTGPELRFDFFVPQATLNLLPCLRLRATVDHQVLPWLTVAVAGPHTYRQSLPGPFSVTRATVDFELEQSLPPVATEERELGGIQVIFWSYEARQPAAKHPFALGPASEPGGPHTAT